MDQQLNDSQESLWALLANPADNPYSYAYNLQQLVYNFPQSAILQALLAHTSIEKNLKQASVYFNAKTLYKLINNPATFNDVPNDRIIIESGICTGAHNGEPLSDENLFTLQDENIGGGEKENYFNDSSTLATEELTEPENHLNGEVYKNHVAETLPETENEDAVSDEVAEKPVDEWPTNLSDSGQGVLANDEAGENYKHNISGDSNEIGGAQKEELFVPVGHEETGEIEEDVFDEIVGIEQINLDRAANSHDADKNDEINAREVESDTVNVAEEKEEFKEEKLGTEHIASTGFFSFERAFVPEDSFGNEDEEVEQVESDSTQSSAKAEPAEREFYIGERQIRLSVDTTQRDVSKYYDEKMPYSFMWWLDKTRKEHAGLYQPYIKSETRYVLNKAKKPGDELQQQYYENIFHVTSLEELDKSTANQTVPFDTKRKEQRIIDRFIQEDPQIRPQSSDKIDNENKAKKSSEDGDELVSETLAHIYTEQMLYHKAIASYKKLMLKFPEKSRYFADKIEQIEKKIN
ncbi:MAG TPA: hypothetical protein VGN20_20170 [Mucilaginibacter sp.]